jgi:hypothetical protein
VHLPEVQVVGAQAPQWPPMPSAEIRTP